MALARDLGERMAKGGHGLVFGGGRVGLMGELARTVHQHGGNVFGVIPVSLRDLELAYEEADELVITDTLRQRKQRMEDEADGFIALPGGVGTFEEMLEILALKQLRMHRKPIVWLNSRGYYDLILEQFERCVAQRFMKPSFLRLYHVASDAADALHYLETYQAPEELDHPYIPPVAGEMLETMP
jgi:uncharacterized protein (TIGR00730 family)